MGFWPARERAAIVPRMSLPRFARGLMKVVAGLALAAVTLYVGGYLALASTPGRAWLASMVADALGPTRVRATIGVAQWGPAPGSLWAADARVELPIAVAEGARLAVRVGLPDLELEAVEVAIDDVAIRLPEAGAPIAAAGATGTGGGGRKNRPTIPDVRVAVRHLELTGPGVQADVRDVDVRGSVGEALELTIGSGPCHVAWMNGRRVSGFDACRVARARLVGSEVEIGGLVLARGSTQVADVRGRATLGKAPEVHLEADLDLASWDAAALAGDQLPEGLVAQGVRLDVVGDLYRGSVAALTAPRYHNGPFDAELVAVAIPTFTGAPGLVLPQVAVTLTGLVAAHAQAFDWSVDGVSAPYLSFDLEKKLVGALPGVRIARWTAPSGVIEDLAIDADMAIGLSGGSVTGLVTTPFGTIEATGHLKKSPITKRATFVSEGAFADLGGPLAALVLHDLDDTQRRALGEPIGGSYALAVDVTHEERYDPYELELSWDETELRGKVALSWDGSSWSEPASQTTGEPHDAPTPEGPPPGGQ